MRKRFFKRYWLWGFDFTFGTAALQLFKLLLVLVQHLERVDIFLRIDLAVREGFVELFFALSDLLKRRFHIAGIFVEATAVSGQVDIPAVVSQLPQCRFDDIGADTQVLGRLLHVNGQIPTALGVLGGHAHLLEVVHKISCTLLAFGEVALHYRVCIFIRLDELIRAHAIGVQPGHQLQGALELVGADQAFFVQLVDTFKPAGDIVVHITLFAHALCTLPLVVLGIQRVQL